MSHAAEVPASVHDLARRLGRDAAEVDATGVLPAGHLRGLAEAGLYGIFAPIPAGGLGLRYEDACPVVEELASACLATTFVWIQHFGTLRALLDEQAPTPLRTRFLPGVIRGEIRSGVALAGLLPGPPRLRATLTSYGWLLDGEAPWVTGWGHIDLVLVTARGPDEKTVISFLVDAREQPGLTATPMRLAAVNASATVRLGFTGLPVPDDRYVARDRYDPVRHQYEGLRLNGSLALGVARRCCALIGPSPLDGELRDCRAELDSADSAHMPAARARASEFAVRAAHVLAVWQGSGSALAGHEAERLTREAAFLLVFGSRPPIKAALLARLGPARRPGGRGEWVLDQMLGRRGAGEQGG
jgi:alkylation response protein AidB-like acyl-CoA dehydrogenase